MSRMIVQYQHKKNRTTEVYRPSLRPPGRLGNDHMGGSNEYRMAIEFDAVSLWKNLFETVSISEKPARCHIDK